MIFLTWKGCKHFMISNQPLLILKFLSQGTCQAIICRQVRLSYEHHSFKTLHRCCGASVAVSVYESHKLEVLALLYIKWEDICKSYTKWKSFLPAYLEAWSLLATWGGFHTAILMTGKWLFVNCLIHQLIVAIVIVSRCYTLFSIQHCSLYALLNFSRAYFSMQVM